MIGVMPAYCLSFQAAYACAHAGACCTAGWTIAVDAASVNVLRTRGLAVTAALATDPACAFYDARSDGSCAIHRTAGEAWLPDACRQFPRVTLTDPRGTFITLSNYCPTAAALLVSGGAIEVVEAPDHIALRGAAHGLDATQVMPPLLRPGLLMDLEGYSRWEREALSVLDDRAFGADQALHAIAQATDETATWSPGTTPLTSYVERAFARIRAVSRSRDDIEERRPLKLFLASHLFASWAAYQRGGLIAILDEVRAAHRLVTDAMAAGTSFIDAVRNTDLRLRHT